MVIEHYPGHAAKTPTPKGPHSRHVAPEKLPNFFPGRRYFIAGRLLTRKRDAHGAFVMPADIHKGLSRKHRLRARHEDHDAEQTCCRGRWGRKGRRRS